MAGVAGFGMDRSIFGHIVVHQCVTSTVKRELYNFHLIVSTISIEFNKIKPC